MSRGRKPNSEKEKDKEREMDYDDFIKEYYSEDTSSKRKREIKIIQRKMMYKKRLQMETQMASVMETQKQIIEHLHAIEMTFHTIKTPNEFDVSRPIQFIARFEPIKEEVQDTKKEKDIKKEKEIDIESDKEDENRFLV